jgi:hypothetical protein
MFVLSVSDYLQNVFLEQQRITAYILHSRTSLRFLTRTLDPHET